MKTSENGLELIKRFEGLSLEPYLCPAGVWTIGYGHTSPFVTEKSEKITEQQAEELLRYDVVKFEKAVNRLITRKLTQNQFDSLVSFCYNLGSGALQRSTLRMKCNRMEDDQVPAEFLKWVYAGGKKLSGLVRRRAAEAGLYNLR